MVLINEDKCVGCGSCVRECPRRIIDVVNGKAKYSDNNCMNCGHCYAVCPVNAVSLSEYGNYDEEKVIAPENSTVDTEVFLNYLKNRRSIRQFSQKDVEKEKLEKIIEALKYSPTSRNCEEISAVVFRKVTDDLLDNFCTWLDEAMDVNIQNGTFVEMSGNYKKHIADYRKDKNNNLFTYNAPCIIGLIIDTDKRKGSKAYYDTGLAAANMETTATSLGLGVLHCGMFTWLNNHEEFRKFLGLTDNQELMIGMLLGYKAPALKYRRIPPRKNNKVTWL